MAQSAVKTKAIVKSKSVKSEPATLNRGGLKLDPNVLRALRAAEAKLITEDDEPVDNPFSEKQQRLLVQTLYSSWTPPAKGRKPRSFWAAANVGIFDSVHRGGIAPDVFVSLDATAPKNWRKNKAYFSWEYGKFPELVLEIVSNTKGGEISKKDNRYAQMGIEYYIVFDPDRYLKGEVLRVFALRDGVYRTQREAYFPVLGLGLKLWEGSFEQKEDTFLRWCDRQGELLLTPDERAARESERATRESERAARESERAIHEAGRAARLAAKLRELGLDPDQL
jgi:Uma2 family endonuclease